MPSLSETMAQLSHLRGGAAAASAGGTGKLVDLPVFGANPGALHARVHIPQGLAGPAALVVALHGCTQTADGYDVGTGWSALADRHGFALLLPEQQRQNNANLCFNWFSPGDIGRDGGEALSIRQMIAAVSQAHDIDPGRVFVTGLSAGGAMAAVMLATYPELFAGGAIIAGLPYGCASGVPQALERMRGQGMPDAIQLAATVRAASAHRGAWPTLSVWQGSADTTVNPKVADAVIGQWRALQGLAVAPSSMETVGGHTHRSWRDESGRVAIEAYDIAGMGHGVPLDTVGGRGCGRSGAFMLEAKISSSERICDFWGLAEAVPHTAAAPADAAQAAPDPAPHAAPAPPSAAQGVGKVIEDALRAAGLMR